MPQLLRGKVYRNWDSQMCWQRCGSDCIGQEGLPERSKYTIERWRSLRRGPNDPATLVSNNLESLEKQGKVETHLIVFSQKILDLPDFIYFLGSTNVYLMLLGEKGFPPVFFHTENISSFLDLHLQSLAQRSYIKDRNIKVLT